MSKSETPAPVPRAMARQVGAECLCLAAQRAARRLARRFDEAFRPLGLTNGQFSLMMALGRPEPWRMAALAEMMAMDRTTLTAALKPLERRGLVRLAADPRDRRARLASLTAQGQALAARALPIWQAEHAALEAALSGAGQGGAPGGGVDAASPGADAPAPDAATLRAGLRALG